MGLQEVPSSPLSVDEANFLGRIQKNLKSVKEKPNDPNLKGFSLTSCSMCKCDYKVSSDGTNSLKMSAR